MTVELHYKLHPKLMPVICTGKNIDLAGLFPECMLCMPIKHDTKF